MDELVVDPSQHAGVAEIFPLEEAVSNQRMSAPLVHTHERNVGVKRRPHQYLGRFGAQRIWVGFEDLCIRVFI